MQNVRAGARTTQSKEALAVARARAARHGRPWGVMIKVAAAVAIVAVCFFGTTFMSPEDAEAVREAGSTDPVSYAEKNYDSTIAYIQDNAIDLTGLVTELRADEEGTSQAKGARDGEAAYTFSVTLTGTTLGAALVAVGPCVQDRVRAVGEHRPRKGQEPRTKPERTLVTWPGRGLGGRRVSCV